MSARAKKRNGSTTTRPVLVLTDSDSEEDGIHDRTPSRYIPKKKSGVEKDIQYNQLSTSSEPKMRMVELKNNPYWNTDILPTETWRQMLIFMFILITLTTIGFTIVVLIQNSYVIQDINTRASKTGKCFQQIDKLSEQSSMWIGRTMANQTTVLPISSDPTFLQNLYINHVFEPISRGRPVWLSRQNEVWIPNTFENTIEVYESTTLNLITIISTISPSDILPCYHPNITSYNPYAGDFERGQVWVSCMGSILGWSVYDPFERTRIAFVSLPPSFGPFIPYDIVTGEFYTVVSLLNTSITFNANVIQYNNSNFLPTILSQVIGPAPLLYYFGLPDSFLFISSYYSDSVYKLNFNSLIVEHVWTNISRPMGISMDPSQSLIYVAESGSNQIRTFYSGNPYFEFFFSPQSSIVQEPAILKSSVSGFYMFLTSLVNTSNTVMFSIGSNSGELIYRDILETGVGSYYLEPNAIDCLCSLCYSQ